MLFPTLTFAAFFMIVWPASWVLARWPMAREVLLLAASWGFYAYWDERYLVLLAATIVVNYACAHAIARWSTRPLAGRVALWTGVSAHLAVLGWFKYYGFFASSLTSTLGGLGIGIEPALVQVVLPLGISFFTFQAISHLVEVRRGVIGPGSLLEVACLLSFFLTISSGPITRSSELFPQLRAKPEPRIEANRGFGLILRGLFKKMVLASFLATAITDDVFASPWRHSSGEVLIGVYGYAAQLYLDFSGYSDIAIGCALLLGIRLPQNFNAPYAARSVTEFWTRWHMTLSRWFRDFVFTPLALHSKPSTAATCRNLLIVMLLAGLWHGAAWTFIAFGAVHGIALAVERVSRQRRRRLSRVQGTPGLARQLAHRIVVFNVVCLGWVFFRAESIDQAFDVLARLGSGLGPSPAVTALLVGVIVTVLAVQNLPRRVLDRAASTLTGLGPAPMAAGAAVSLLLIDVLGPEGVPPFLYFGF